MTIGSVLISLFLRWHGVSHGFTRMNKSHPCRSVSIRGQQLSQSKGAFPKELAPTLGLCDIDAMRILSPWALALVVIAAAALSAQQKSDADTVHSLEMKWTESYKQRNIEILSSLLADDFVITVEDGSVYSKAGYISHSADSGTKVQVAELSDLKVRMHGNTAIVNGAYHEKGESNGKPYDYHDRLTDCWVKTGGKWQVVASHYSVPYKP
jgi:ketosteroid isomerase-like protein